MPWTNYHSHTHYCDGKSKPEKYIESALQSDLLAYGFSSHAPVPFDTDWCIADTRFMDYMKEVSRLKEKYKSQLPVYMGLEVDYIPEVAGRQKHLLKDRALDFFIGSIHFIDQFKDGTHWGIDTSVELFSKGYREIFNSDFKQVATRFYELTWQMLDEDQPDIIGHLDKVKMYNNTLNLFSGNEAWYIDLVEKTLRKIAEHNTIVEINTRGFYKYGQQDLYPSDWIIKKMIAMKIPIMLNSDAHAPEELTSGFAYTSGELLKMGLKELWVLLDGKWQPKQYTSSGYLY